MEETKTKQHYFIAIKDGSFEGGIDFTEAFDILYKIGGEQIS